MYRVVSEWFANESVTVTLKEFVDYVKEEWGYTPRLKESDGCVSIRYYYDLERHTRLYDGMPEFDKDAWIRNPSWEIVLEKVREV